MASRERPALVLVREPQRLVGPNAARFGAENRGEGFLRELVGAGDSTRAL